jgi:hypothetical protein
MAMRIRLFKDIPNGTVFKVMKENGRHVPGRPDKPAAPAVGWYLKVSNARSQRYGKTADIILGLRDVVQVVAFPSERSALPKA